ncbi:S1 family peptidase [Shewanella xiamenensis]|uniref:S1 family peptidase n=1 Tax=Shewanella xiamenensis TaxID=332186 RepID=UPI0024A69A42|nr:S1 family peptidase [Shewanella xiamenensis]MDI5835860.1 trypsin-like serine protease [Shewanella xiamenensis]MDI5839327.1 trypsin-like serine protease [Shewanella xiamenensis]MDI5842713.1 trypsin-like serine protease [Shewanella xiamenensis]MDI5847295.1 trypsin-like serine protease [Shewanella xiamenensis]MDI5850594.1 trypsin-like serine protease [Shewanella xiamenensis]
MKWMFVLLLAITCTANAMIIRHDVDDAKYQAAAQSDNSTVSFLGLYKGNEIVLGTGSLIDKQWIVTAAHVANELTVGNKVQFKTHFYPIKDVIKHPLWKERHFPYDIALVQLASPIEDATLAKLNPASTETGKIATFVGRGDFGNGLVGVVAADKQLRAAHNAVVGVQEQWLQFIFDRDANALPLEGISGPGDSGGPAYLVSTNSVCLIGVSSWQNAESTNWEEGKYGVIEHYSRISYFRDWIEKTLLQISGISPEICPDS